MTILDVAWIIVQAAFVFAASTFLFDILHYLLHAWEKSRFGTLRAFARWHNVHHQFLDKNMDVHPELVRQNLVFHLLPEFASSMAGTLVFTLFCNWWAVGAVALAHTVLFVARIIEEGRDFNHMAMDRLSGTQGFWLVTPSYHALHHIHPHAFYSSFLSLFDLIAGTGCQIGGRRFLVTGAGGAFGTALVKRLRGLGATVTTAKFGTDYRAGDYSRMRPLLEAADVVVLAHGTKSVDCWNANYRTFVDLIDLFEEIGRDRLTPPEVWALGSEAELHGDFGLASLKDYAASKRAFAARALGYYTSRDLIYRHIVPSAFTSAMGPGLISAATAAAVALFLIRRGFTYVPVTYTTLALWNYLRFRFQRSGAAEAARASSQG
ncbi:MAG: hypothetical protein WEB63_02165 [Cucumibacter sp.]